GAHHCQARPWSQRIRLTGQRAGGAPVCLSLHPDYMVRWPMSRSPLPGVGAESPLSKRASADSCPKCAPWPVWGADMVSEPTNSTGWRGRLERGLGALAMRNYRRPGWALAVALVLSLLGAFFARGLSLDANLVSLLPRSFQSVQDVH